MAKQEVPNGVVEQRVPKQVAQLEKRLEEIEEKVGPPKPA